MEATTASAPPSARMRAIGLKGVQTSRDAAALKREIREGLDLLDALGDPRARRMRLFDLLLARRGWGQSTVKEFLLRVGIGDVAATQRRIEELMPPQIERVRCGLRDPGYEAPRW